jgi:hypothetical protein
VATRALAVDAAGVVWVLQGSGGALERIDPATAVVTTVAGDLARGGLADHYLDFALGDGDGYAYVASGGMTMEGVGPYHIDLTKPNPKLPKTTFGGDVLRVSTASPPDALTRDASTLEVALVWCYAGEARFQDPANAVRWIDELAITDLVPDIKAGKVGLVLVAETSAKVAEPLARARAALVEEAIRGRLGPAVRVAIEARAESGYHGDVAVTIDRDDLARWMEPPASARGGRGP